MRKLKGEDGVSCKIFVGNLPWKTAGDDLGALLDSRGHTRRGVKVIVHQDTGNSRGFAFVEYDVWD